MIENGLQRQLKAILSADVKGYSKLMGEDDESTVNTITAYREIISDFVEKHQGRVVDSPGDNILAEFGSTLNAVNGAIAIQQRLEKENEKLPANRRMKFRIGINLGDIIHKGDRIYGDGVNVAARIESLADPGGICISRNVFDQIKRKVPQGFEYMGEHAVKNIAEPVRIYRVLLAAEYEGRVIGEPTGKSTKVKNIYALTVVSFLICGAVALWLFYSKAPEIEPASKEKMEYPLPDKPSIAVLPFDNMSDDPEQEYFSNGISENLITDLSKVPGLIVISRTSSFSYKDKPITIEAIAKDLNVGYIIEGSVQKAGDKLRINAQLIDTSTGHHLWADRYDGSIRDVFSLQDKITQKIAASLAVRLTNDEKNHLKQIGTENIEAYEAFLKGLDTAHYLRMDPEHMAKSIPFFEKAIELDSNYADAYALLAETYMRGSILGIDRKLGISLRLNRLRAAKYLRIAMKNPTHFVYREMARMSIMKRQHDEAMDFAEKAIALAPNDADNNSVMAQALIYSGKPNESIAYCEKMRKIDPACLF